MTHKHVHLFSFCCVAFRSSFCNSIEQGTKKLMIGFIIFYSISSCSCNDNKAGNDADLPSTDSSVFYPVHEYFITQLKSLDSHTNIIYKYSELNKKDSIAIDTTKFKELAKPFLENDLNDKTIKKYYRESVFRDETTESYTFSYVSVNPSLPLQSLDILLDTATGEVKRVFMIKIFLKGDTTINEKMGWKTGNSFFINRIKKFQGKEITQQLSVLWQHNN